MAKQKPTYKTYSNGTKKWWLNGKLHREDGPAVEHANGYKAWYLNGKLHREDGPAVEHANGDKYWCLNGKLHREDGPAREWANGYKEYWYDGVYYGREYNKFYRLLYKYDLITKEELFIYLI